MQKQVLALLSPEARHGHLPGNVIIRNVRDCVQGLQKPAAIGQLVTGELVTGKLVTGKLVTGKLVTKPI